MVILSFDQIGEQVTNPGGGGRLQAGDLPYVCLLFIHAVIRAHMRLYTLYTEYVNIQLCGTIK